MKINIEIDTDEDLQMVADKLRNLAYSFEQPTSEKNIDISKPIETVVKDEFEKLHPTPQSEEIKPDPEISQNQDLDSRGFKWDARIHSANRTTLAKTGEWKNKRGVDPNLVKEVEKELLLQTVAGEEPEESNQLLTPSEEVSEVEPEKTVELAPPPPPVEMIPETPVSATLNEAQKLNFASLIARINSERVSAETIDRVCVDFGINSINVLMVRPDLFSAVHAALFPNG